MAVERIWDFAFCPDCGSDYTYLKPDNGSSIRYAGCNKCSGAQWEVTAEQAAALKDVSLKWRRLQIVDDLAWTEREKMQEYVCGFAFDRSEHVVLIRKTRPAWQDQFLNGIGGKVETDESPIHAMVREFTEETGTVCEEWSLFATMVFPAGKIYFYRAFLDDLSGMRTVTDEEIIVAPLVDIKSSECVANLFWLLPLAAFTKENYEPITVTVDTGEPTHMIGGEESDELMAVAMRKSEVDACLE